MNCLKKIGRFSKRHQNNLLKIKHNTTYVNSCIYRHKRLSGLLYNRTDKLRPLGEFAFNLFKKSVECEYEIIVSDILFTELNAHADEKIITEMFEWLDSKIFLIESTKEERLIARNQKNRNDYLHLLLAKRSNAEILVTRNLSDYPVGILLLELPENL